MTLIKALRVDALDVTRLKPLYLKNHFHVHPSKRHFMSHQPIPRWEDILEVPKPATCNTKAACCSVATPSLPVDDLLARAAEGDETCRDFLSVFIPHDSPQAAKTFYPEGASHIDRVLALVGGKSTRSNVSADRVVFYHCRNLGANKLCQIYEDRPTFCRDYPTSPMNILIKGCGYEAWATACQAKLKDLGFEVVEQSGQSEP